MRTAEGKIRPKVLFDIADECKCASNDDSSHRVPDETQASARPELHVLEEAIQLYGETLSEALYGFFSFAFVCRTDEHSAAILDLKAGLEQCEILA